LIAAHRLEGSDEILAADVADLEARDEARRDAGLPPTGLTDDARYLAAALAATRDAQREALQAVLKAHPDPLVRRLAEHELEVDEAATADRLLADDRHNRRAAVLNDAVRPLGIVSDDAARPLARVNEARARRAAREEAGRWPIDDPPQPTSADELSDYHRLLVATALADPGAMIEAASRFREHHDESPFAPSALYVV